MPWRLEDGSLNVVFTSNFFEHLPDKAALGRTLEEIFRCLAPNGKLIAMGPNIKHLPGKYWDFWDHHLALTETSLSEGLTNRGFEIAKCVGKFLPYTMVNSARVSRRFSQALPQPSDRLADFRKAIFGRGHQACRLKWIGRIRDKAPGFSWRMPLTVSIRWMVRAN